MGGEHTYDKYYRGARNNRGGAVEAPDYNAGDGAGDRGAGIDMPYEYVRLLPREHIAQDSAADTGYDSDK